MAAMAYTSGIESEKLGDFEARRRRNSEEISSRGKELKLINRNSWFDLRRLAEIAIVVSCD